MDERSMLTNGFLLKINDWYALALIMFETDRRINLDTINSLKDLFIN